MSQNDSESDIWEYKSLSKVKKRDALASNKKRGPKNKPDTVINGSKSAEKFSSRGKVLTQGKTDKLQKEQSQQDKQLDALTSPNPDATAVEYGSRSRSSEEDESRTGREEFCPGCQMPFSILLVQSQRWHLSECLDMIGVDREECPDGFKCSSTIPSHYRKYSHFLLAHSRATNDESSLSTGSSQEIVTNDFTPSSQSPSPSPSLGGLSQSSTPTRRNAFLLLKSPAAGDIKKKKGWSPTVKQQKTASLEPGSGVTLTPNGTGSVSETLREDQKEADPTSPSHSVTPRPPTPSSDSDEISYSPISTPPPVSNGIPPPRRSPSYSCISGAEEGEAEGGGDSVMLYSDDELLADFLTQAEMEGVCLPGNRTAAVSSESMEARRTSLLPRTLLAPPFDEVNDSSIEYDSFDSTAGTSLALNEVSTPAPDCPVSGPKQPVAIAACSDHTQPNGLKLQSPQSLVLEQLRERIRSAGEAAGVDPDVSSDDPAGVAMPSVTRGQAQESATPRKARGKAGVAATGGLKQTDIGVFFGLRPLKSEARAASAKENLPGAGPVAGGDAGAWPKGRQRKRKATSSASETPPVLGASDGDPNQVPQAEPGGRGAGRRRWRRRTEDGSEAVRRCPFYKKIPGTPFAVDAFQYGAIEGIRAYFLTHFHSDHYNGLRKSSSLPIYCNRITGNLVKSKLRVEEQYIHILPMNTECTVEGIRVTLLDANHCPGAAMLLLLLPDGQTVLHTGDFRADPSMESYPELQRCRVQTLYLDTTYCSPEYTFPTQQEVITFAVNRAFEQVAINPRTLVVCGTYSVGKEKVFLAIAEVLGCKVSLSRDKYNTMCCLESDRIRQLITTDGKAAQVHVLPMMQLNFRNLEAYLSKFSAKYDQVLAFKPTGWTYTNQSQAVQDIQPEIRGNIHIYGIPYSEHSSYLEMKRFVQWLRPLKVIPTVNVGSWASRKAMERLFGEWRAESGGRPANGDAAAV